MVLCFTSVTKTATTATATTGEGAEGIVVSFCLSVCLSAPVETNSFVFVRQSFMADSVSIFISSCLMK